MRLIDYLIPFVASLVLVASCDSDVPTTDVSVETTVSTVVEPPPTTEVPPPVATAPDTVTADTTPVAQKIERPNRRPPEMTFVTTSHEYDTIDQGTVVEYEFQFTNTGERPLTIKDVQGSCGCTIGSYSFLDIAPNEQSTIKARFDSKGKQGPQFTTITVYSNANPKGEVLSLKGVVRGPDGSVAPNTVAH